MLPSSGYFRDIRCPFRKLGLCERLHCHYRHDDPQTKQFASRSHSSAVLSSASSASSTTMPIYVPTPVAKLKTVLNHAQESSSSAHTSKYNDNIDKQLPLNMPIYKPTPISELKKRKNDNDNDKDNDNVNRSKTKSVTKKLLSSESVKTLNKTNKSLSLNSDKRNTKKDLNKQKEDIDDDDSIDKSQDIESDKLNDINKRKSFDEVIDQSDDGYSLTKAKKMRVAHHSAAVPVPVPKKSARPSPSQMMHQRFIASQTNPKTKSEHMSKDSQQNVQNATGRMRVAHQPKTKNDNDNNSSSSVTIGTKTRIAHKPSVLKRPTIAHQYGNKVPVKLRQLYLNKFIDELLIFCEEDEAFKRGLEIEKSVYDRCSSRNIYMNLSVNSVKRIREESHQRTANCISTSSSGTSSTGTRVLSSPIKSSLSGTKSLGNRVVSHESILNGPITGTFSIEKRIKSVKESELSDIEMYGMLLHYVLNEQQRKDYGYPRLDPSARGCAIIPKTITKVPNNYESQLRTCSRCQKTYTVNDMGMPIKRETCIYHPGKLWNERFNRSIERKYSCCKNDAGAGGCCTNKCHVINGYDHPDYSKGYVKTLPKRPSSDSEFYGIYALDCEMCYTTFGLELTRVTVINTQEQIIYESLVKPLNPILDYNSKFSGIKEGDLNTVTTTLSDVQTHLITLFNEKTILIGHSLDSDFRALKLIHDTVIDTAQVFPHKRGLPYKRALRTLTAEFLKKIIQDDVGGHDSKEDAIAAMKLMLLKVREDLKRYQR